MSILRKLEICNFRGIQTLNWNPSPGINALIGPGDSCKSTILDAIDWCLGARRSLLVGESDFFQLDTSNPITIIATVGHLPDELKSLTRYGEYLKGFNLENGELYDEPAHEYDVVLQLALRIEQDLEPQWYVLPRSTHADLPIESLPRVPWSHRQLLSPSRIGSNSVHHLSWRRDSALTKLSPETVSASEVIANALRNARNAFSAVPRPEISPLLTLAAEQCTSLAISTTATLKAELDIDVIGTGSNAIALHDENGIPLRTMGTGSTRLLVSALLSKVSSQPIALIDELEYGLEPFRIIRLLHALGSKNQEASPQQVFFTTHSPVVVRELDVIQLWIVRNVDSSLFLLQPSSDLQGITRVYPEAFLGKKVMVCEGASEVGIIRGLDLYLNALTDPAYAGGLALRGVIPVDAGGFGKIHRIALAFQSAGFPTAIFRDSDVILTSEQTITESSFIALGGQVFAWPDGQHLESGIFNHVSDDVILQLLEYAKELRTPEAIDVDLRSFSQGSYNLKKIEDEMSLVGTSEANRCLLGLTANKREWFKRITPYEHIAANIVLPKLPTCTRNAQFIQTLFGRIFHWCVN
jgi:putative ATP-dependent endonuclease of OLD family